MEGKRRPSTKRIYQMQYIKYLILIILFSSCSANWYLRKAVFKDPEIIKVETVKVIDTVFVEIEKIDTLFRYKFDTVEFWKDSVYVKYFYETKDSTVYLEVDCPDNAVITETTTKTKIIKQYPTFRQKIFYGFLTFIALFMITLIAWILLRKLKHPS